MNNKETLISHIEECIPKLRFPEFKEKWKEFCLGNISASFEYGLNVSSKKYDGINKYLRITDIDDCYHNLKQDNLTSPNIDFINYDKFKLKNGDILFARTGASVGKTYIYKNTDGIIYFAGYLIRMRLHDNYDPDFIFQNTLTKQYNKYISITSKRSGQPGINAQEYSKYKLIIPSYTEQIKVGYFLSKIDKLIELHQNKLNILNKYKKGLLLSVFTSFSKDKIISLKELIDKNIIEIKRGNIIPKQNGIYPVYSSSIQNNGLFCYSDNYMFDEELVSWSIDGGGNFFYRPKHKFSLTNVTGYIKVKNKNILNTQYLYYNLDYLSHSYNFDYQNKALPSYISKLYKIYLPPIKVQEKTAKILSTFDELIEKENNILSLLKKYKQGLLQQMFI